MAHAGRASGRTGRPPLGHALALPAGPVLSTDVQTRSTNSTLDPWSADQVYLEGSTVLHDGLVYKAKWWTQADTPSADRQGLGNLPWQLVGRATATQLAAASTRTGGVSAG